MQALYFIVSLNASQFCIRKVNLYSSMYNKFVVTDGKEKINFENFSQSWLANLEVKLILANATKETHKIVGET